jgi:hypothetical protein
MIQNVHPGYGLDFLTIPDPGVKKGPGFWIRNTVWNNDRETKFQQPWRQFPRIRFCKLLTLLQIPPDADWIKWVSGSSSGFLEPEFPFVLKYLV